MTDESDLIPVITQILSDNDAINTACDGFIYPGRPGPAIQDASLEGAHQTAVWIRRISKTEKPFVGSVLTGEYLYDQLIQVDVLSRSSEVAAFDLADLVEALLKATSTKTYSGSTRHLNLLLHSRMPVWDDTLLAWVEMVRFRAKGT
jgi:hypothetical protein